MVAAAPLRVAFFGTPSFAVATLNALLDSSHCVAVVVTQPDRGRGRGQHVSDAPVKARAVEAGIPVLQPLALGGPEFLEAVGRYGVDVGIVAAYGRILPASVLSWPKLGMVNVHASLLPRYRGAAPVHRAVIAGERETGVTIMRVVQALDAGPTLASVRRPIGDDETSEEVERDLAQKGARLLVSTVDDLAAGTAIETPQDDAAATYAPRLTKTDGVVDWSRSARGIHDLIRGLHPWPHAFTYLNGGRLILLRSSASSDETGAAPGTVVAAHGTEFRVAAGSGVVIVRELQAGGKRPMNARDFLAGHPVVVGTRLSGQ